MSNELETKVKLNNNSKSHVSTPRRLPALLEGVFLPCLMQFGVDPFIDFACNDINIINFHSVYYLLLALYTLQLWTAGLSWMLRFPFQLLQGVFDCQVAFNVYGDVQHGTMIVAFDKN